MDNLTFEKANALLYEIKKLQNKTIYIFESNHNIEMLMHGRYPKWLKELSEQGDVDLHKFNVITFL